MLFELMHKDVIVTTISLNNDEITPVKVHNPKYYPVKEGSILTLSLWNEERCVPNSRPHFEQILRQNNTTSVNGLLPYSYLCSLTDNYWFRPQGSNVCWKDVNFYDNKYNSNLYRNLFFQTNEPITNLNSPDLTTCGCLSKYWFKNSRGQNILRKESKSYEAESEYIASHIAKILGISSVLYEVVKVNDILCSDCPSFILNDRFEFVPIKVVMYKTQQIDPIKVIENLGLLKEFEKIMLIDCFMQNNDRHLYNYGFIVDSESQKIISMAPLFDTGASCIDTDYDFLDYQPTGESFVRTFKHLSEDTKVLLKKLSSKDLENIIANLSCITVEEKQRILNNMVQRLKHMTET